MRLPRPQIEDCCVHVTHRCQERRFLLKFDLDMNMVRAGVVAHPFLWRFGGAAELCGQRQRYRVTDRERLLWCLGTPGEHESFREWYKATLDDLCRPGHVSPGREPHWTSAFAVGDPDWLRRLGGEREDLSPYVRPVPVEFGGAASESHVLQVPQTVLLRLWHGLGG